MMNITATDMRLMFSFVAVQCAIETSSYGLASIVTALQLGIDEHK